MARVEASRLAPAGTALLGLLLGRAAASTAHEPYTAVLLGVLAGVALLAAVRLCTARCIESRVAAAAVALATVAGVVLASTVGPPGSTAHPVDVTTLALGLTAAVALALVVAPEQERVSAGDLYAR
ncbi:hypothetical protein [Aeromicrobium sp. 50.2.37]|uniref:hypothetical protein n=1 Tax=Aeromicrobium sp. 50.2.37 TaxID=2969305 RepID=UPI00214FDF86|nr:hypothetical protein [Aeromicrobium sp. 50.2.37]MCR4514315.1 hypothetical protein [Aeromicrobium sp. 50.2.37]